MNILITSAGRRVELVRDFKVSLNKLIPEAFVYAADANPSLSAACHVADDYFLVPRVDHESYIQRLLEICVEKKVGIVIPTIDTELELFANNTSIFLERGIKVLSCSSDLVSQCRDKRKTSLLFADLDIPSPQIFTLDHIRFPAFCKPYDGSCSVGAMRLNSRDDLTASIMTNPKNIFMEYVDSDFKEFTCDAYFDRDSNLKCLVPRERLEVRAGEVSKAITRKNFVYEFLVDRLNNLKGAFGCVTFQVFGNPSTGEIKGLEINPRFGGGYPLTVAAGASYAAMLIREYLLDEAISFVHDWHDGVVMLRYDAHVICSENE